MFNDIQKMLGHLVIIGGGKAKRLRSASLANDMILAAIGRIGH
jgi:hypothetical protein